MSSRGKFKLKDDYVYKMPVHFGGDPFYPVRTIYRDMTGISIQFETDQEALLEIIPHDFELLEPVVNVQYSNCRDVDWMAGGEYRLIQVASPVRYMGNSEGLEGQYVFVIWENKTCPIIGGREEDGMPKVFADISCERHLEDHWFTAASYESYTFLKLDFVKTGELDDEAVKEANENPKINFFGWRYIPNLGKAGASLSHATLYPQEAYFSKIWTGNGHLEWTKLNYEKHPLQFRIISALAELPVVRYTEAKMSKNSARLNVGDSRILP